MLAESFATPLEEYPVLTALRSVTGPSVNVVNCSGGKDSTAMYLLALELEVPYRAVFADVQNEHPWTYEYIEALHRRTNGPPVEVVRADLTGKFPRKRKTIAEEWPKKGIPDAVVERALAACHPTGNVFLDACILRAGFPSSSMRFCTDRLKVEPVKRLIFDPIWESEKAVVSWQGVRADESFARRDLPGFQQLNERRGDYYVSRPLIEWTIHDVWAMLKRHRLPRNPLYDHGMTRVGCLPCIFSRKSELRIMAERFPEAVDRIEAWEHAVALASKHENPIATWFPAIRRPGVEKQAINTYRHGIRDAADWAKTSRGGRQYDLLPITDISVEMRSTTCASIGYCE